MVAVVCLLLPVFLMAAYNVFSLQFLVPDHDQSIISLTWLLVMNSDNCCSELVQGLQLDLPLKLADCFSKCFDHVYQFCQDSSECMSHNDLAPNPLNSWFSFPSHMNRIQQQQGSGMCRIRIDKFHLLVDTYNQLYLPDLYSYLLGKINLQQHQCSKIPLVFFPK